MKSTKRSTKTNEEEHHNAMFEEEEEKEEEEADEIAPPGDDELRIMVATDNHLGFMVNDPVRGEDSFETFEEILRLARRYKCDMMVLGGDLFHHNKPSRRTMFRAQQIFRKHVFGEGDVKIRVVSDQKLNFGSHERVNYEDPNLSVQLPIFIIHGNHDDPTREGTEDVPLSAIDLLAEAGLVNYFGRAENTEEIRVRPVVIEKGPIRLALYGLGWVRDERLSRIFANRRVLFVKPSERASDFFNLFLVHQNRDFRGRGDKNAVSERMIPEFMDLVVWGHEHDCQIKPIQRARRWFLSQPGSSVATSLVEGEAIQKHVGILEVRLGSVAGEGITKSEEEDGDDDDDDDDDESRHPPHRQIFRLVPVPLKTVRPFLLEEVELSSEEEMQNLDSVSETDRASDVYRFLTARVHQALARHKQGAGKLDPRLPLVRFKVEHTGYPIVNHQMFGAQFANQVANPNEILQFWRRKSLGVGARGKRDDGNDDDDEDSGSLGEDRDGEVEGEDVAFVSPQEQIARLAEQMLHQAGNTASRLEILSEPRLFEAVEEYVGKESTSAIDDFVQDSVKKLADVLKKERDARDEGAIKAAIERVVEHERKKEEVDKSKRQMEKERAEIQAGRERRKKNEEENDDEEEEENEVVRDVNATKTKTTATGRTQSREKVATSTTTSSKVREERGKKRKYEMESFTDDEEEEGDDGEDDEDDEGVGIAAKKKKKNAMRSSPVESPAPAATKKSSTARGKTTHERNGRRREDDDDDDDDEEEEAEAKAPRPSVPPSKTVVMSLVSSDEEQEDARKVGRSKPTSSAPPRGKGESEEKARAKHDEEDEEEEDVNFVTSSFMQPNLSQRPPSRHVPRDDDDGARADGTTTSTSAIPLVKRMKKNRF